ncbi:MAG: rhodanese-like domain-containing protein [Acidobacteriaceae bacterium]
MMILFRNWMRRLPAAAVVLMLVGAVPHDAPAQAAPPKPGDPWTQFQVTPPMVLAAILKQNPTGTTATDKPVVLQTGFAVLYRSEHIPGSIYAGPASTPAGLEMLKQAVAKLPKDSQIYIYCGCCPIDKCPNIRPAFETLQHMGFKNLHIVSLETSFGKDWVAKGYPVVGESAPKK